MKAYGYNREGVMNASVEFDIETLSPTYKLLIGVLGSKQCFRNFKTPRASDHIIGQAKSEMTAEHNEVDTMIASLEQSKKRAEEELSETESIRKEAEKLHKELQQQIIELNSKKDKMLEEAEQQAAEKVKAAMKEAEDIIHELRSIKEEHKSFKDHELINAKKRLEGAMLRFLKSPRNRKSRKRKNATLSLATR
nr:hypothetical protein P5640_01630 [Bacillus subtilis]